MRSQTKRDQILGYKTKTFLLSRTEYDFTLINMTCSLYLDCADTLYLYSAINITSIPRFQLLAGEETDCGTTKWGGIRILRIKSYLLAKMHCQ